EVGRSGPGCFVDGVDPVGIKGEMVLDDRYRGVGRLIAPHRVGRTLATERDAEIGAIPFVWAIGGVIGARGLDRLRCRQDCLFHGVTSLFDCRVYGQAADFPPSTESTWPVVK